MNRLLLFFLLIISVVCQGQGYLDSMPLLHRGEILIIGEYHNVKEIHDLELDVVRHYAEKSQDSVVILLEWPYEKNYYVNRLFSSNDSTLFFDYSDKQYEMYGPSMYNKLMTLYHINQKTHNMKVFCYDNVASTQQKIYIVHDMLNTYPSLPEPILSIRMYLDSSLQAHNPDFRSKVDSFGDVHKFFLSHFNKYRNLYKKTLLPEDFKLLCHKQPSFSNNYDLRESVLYRNVRSHYDRHCLYIAICGATHANKEKILSDKKYKNKRTKPLAWQLNQKIGSPFRQKVHTICVAPYITKYPATVINDTLTIPPKEMEIPVRQIPSAVKRELSDRSEQIAVKRTNLILEPELRNQFDAYILIHTAHTTVPGNRERQDEIW